MASPPAGNPALPPPGPPSSARVLDAGGAAAPETRVDAARGQRFELRFPGSGWLYLGDEQGNDGIRYETRRFQDSQAVFVLNPERDGEYLLRFQRQNPVDQSTETSMIRVVVGDKATASGAAAPAAPGRQTGTGSASTSVSGSQDVSSGTAQASGVAAPGAGTAAASPASSAGAGTGSAAGQTSPGASPLPSTTGSPAISSPTTAPGVTIPSAAVTTEIGRAHV